MKYNRVYETEKRFYGGKVYECKVLTGYKCDLGFIEVLADVTLSGDTTRDYVANGWRFSTLRAAKDELENNTVSKERGLGPRLAC